MSSPTTERDRLKRPSRIKEGAASAPEELDETGKGYITTRQSRVFRVWLEINKQHHYVHYGGPTSRWQDQGDSVGALYNSSNQADNDSNTLHPVVLKKDRIHWSRHLCNTLVQEVRTNNLSLRQRLRGYFIIQSPPFLEQAFQARYDLFDFIMDRPSLSLLRIQVHYDCSRP